MTNVVPDVVAVLKRIGEGGVADKGAVLLHVGWLLLQSARTAMLHVTRFWKLTLQQNFPSPRASCPTLIRLSPKLRKVACKILSI